MYSRVHVSSLLVTLLFGSLILGCNGSKQIATAYLRVNREKFDGTSSDFMIYKETLAGLLTSQFVLQMALKTQGLPKDLQLENLKGRLKVTVAEDELIYVTLRKQAKWTKPETERILNAVLESYVSNVVNKEQLEKVEQLSKRRKRYATIYQRIVKDTEEIASLARHLSGPDYSDTEKSRGLGLHRLRTLQNRLIDLRLAQIAARENAKSASTPNPSTDDATESESDESTSVSTTNKADKVMQAQIAFLENQIQEVQEKLSPGNLDSGELRARQVALDALMKDLAPLQEQMNQLEIELDEGPAVQIIQDATLLHTR